jgi:hypothetical protein
MPSMCWLHPEGDEHEVTLLVGVRLPDSMTAANVVPADLRCARQFPDECMLPATEINVEVVRS